MVTNDIYSKNTKMKWFIVMKNKRIFLMVLMLFVFLFVGCFNDDGSQNNLKGDELLLEISINAIDYSIDLSNNIIKVPNNDFALKKALLNENDIYYMS